MGDMADWINGNDYDWWKAGKAMPSPRLPIKGKPRTGGNKNGNPKKPVEKKEMKNG